MLAATLESLDEAKLPAIVSPKLDGIRCCILGGAPHTRRLKRIPNDHIRSVLSGLPAFDGEIIVPGGSFSDAQSAVMGQDGTPNFEFQIFDMINQATEFHRRVEQVALEVERLKALVPQLTAVEQVLVKTPGELIWWEQNFVSQGYEGIMLRDPVGPYKNGRSTLREFYLVKLKRWAIDEAIIRSVQPLMHNENELQQSELGYAKRSSAQAGKVATLMLGSMDVEDVRSGVRFSVGAGFDEATREDLWLRRAELEGKIIRYKHQPSGADMLPRFPIFAGFRDERDMGEPDEEG